MQEEITTEYERNGRTQIAKMLVIDVGATSGPHALDKAAELLVARKWVISAENRPTIVSMDSARWQGTHVVVRPFAPLYFEDHPEVLERLKESSVQEESLVYLEVFHGTL
ncbi:hypothetical protein AB0B45_33045 [Nonomuraea sp. NPDC049152]|uniref:hypothetical protein n=1 Tax=Nonomuraea sp. NPDC049152 TaxID=3154350 RepID=UPI0033FE1A44